MSNPTISRITLPSGTTYDICDLTAREAAAHGMAMNLCTDASNTPQGVEWMSGGTKITGTLAASASTQGAFFLVPVTTRSGRDIYAEYVTVSDGAPAPAYSWEKIGTTDIDLSDLGGLAYKDSASGSYTPQGSVTGGTFSGSSTTFTGNFTPQGSVAVNAAGGSGTSYTPSGSISVNAAGGSGTSYTPEGSVSAPVISVSSAGATASVIPFGTAGSLPSLTTTVSDGNLTISFSQGTLPTAGTAVTVKTGDALYTATAPSFTGTEKKLAFSGDEKRLAFSGTRGSVSVSGTPNGSNSALGFSGTAAAITVS